jgi:ubiquinone/menaquinone biosynthesis C-methylase UbiE
VLKLELRDEIALAGAEHLDPRYVDAYDRKAGFDPEPDLALLRGRGLGAGSTLVDLGAATGTFAVAAAAEAARVVAVDVSPAMVAAARARVAALGVTNVECVQAGFLSYEHAGEAANFAYSRNTLHHLPDFWKAVALERVARLLRPGGVFRLRDIVFACGPGEAETVVDAWVGTAAPSPELGWTREELDAHVRDEHSTFSWLLEPMLERAGFEIEQADYGPLRVYAEYLCVRKERP